MELRTFRHRIQVAIRSSRGRGTLFDFRRRKWKPHAEGPFNTTSTARPIAGDARLDLIAPDVVVLLRRSWIFGGENFLFHKYAACPFQFERNTSERCATVSMFKVQNFTSVAEPVVVRRVHLRTLSANKIADFELRFACR
jgi:hypothetical protein